MESIKESLKENIEKAAESADTNKDGIVDIFEWVQFLIQNPLLVLLGIIIISINPVIDFVKNGLSTGEWDAMLAISSITNAILGFVWYWIQKTGIMASQKIIQKLKTAYDEIIKAKDSAYSKIMAENIALREETAKWKSQYDMQVRYCNDFMIPKSGSTDLMAEKIAAAMKGKLIENQPKSPFPEAKPVPLDFEKK